MRPPVKNPEPLTFRTLIRWRWPLFLGAMLAASISQVAGIPLALLTRRMVKLVASQANHHHPHYGEIRATLFHLGAMLVALSLVRGVARWVKVVLGEIFAQRTIADLRKRMLSRIHFLSMGYFDRRAAGKVIIRFVGDALGMRGWLGSRMVGIPADSITIVAVVFALRGIDWRLCCAAVVPLVVVVPLLLYLNPRSRRWTREGRKEQSRLTGNLTDRVSLMPELKATGSQEVSLPPLFERIDGSATAFIRRGLVDAWGRAMAISSGSLSICCVGIWGAVLILHGEQTSGDIVGAIWLAVLLRAPVNRLTSSNVAYQRVKVGFDRINGLLSRRMEVGWDEGLEPFTGEGLRVRLRDVGYRDRHHRWILRDLTATLQGPGLFVVRGDPGARQALWELILRLRRPQEGRLALDGKNVRKLRVDDLRARIGWVDAARRCVQTTLVAHGIEAVRAGLAQTEGIGGGPVDPAELEHLQSFEHRTRLHGIHGLRLALGCALVGSPPILLIDGPEADLTREEWPAFEAWLLELAQDRLVLVASDVESLVAHARRVLYLDRPKVDAVS